MAEAQSKTELAYVLAEHVARATYERIPAEAVEAAKKSILDTLGVILGASGTTSSVRGLVDMVKEAGGKKESTIIGFGGRVPAWMAAFVNGSMAHCLDYDDHIPAGHHPSSAVVPASFAVAERVGTVNGKDFITAVALGQDIFIRLRQSIRGNRIWHLTPVLGVFAAAAACGKIVGLEKEKLVDAFGIASCQSACTQELGFGVGSDLRGMYPAFSSKGGVLSSLMAESGVVGIKSCFEGKAGFFQAYFDGEWDRESVLAGLGKKFAGATITYKPWPACGATHVYIDATLNLVEEHDLSPEDIAEMRVFVGDFAQNLCQPLEGRRKPATTLDAKFSIPFSVAVAAAHRKVVIGDFTGKGLADPVVLGLAQRIIPVPDERFNRGTLLPPGLVEITTKDGRSFSKLTEHPRGYTTNPLIWDDLVAKFTDCAAYSAKPVPRWKVDKAIAMVHNLEEEEDATKIIRLLG